MITNTPAACPVCLSHQTHEFFALHGVPTQAGHLALSQDEAVDCELGDLEMQHCRSCGHLWNKSYDPSKVHFDPNYEFSQYHSPQYQDYIAGTIEHLKSRYGLEGKTAIDVGCGKGDWMQLMLKAGLGRAIGFDPTYEPREFDADVRDRVTVYRKNYDETEASIDADLVTSRGVLHYVPDPRAMMSSIRRTLGGREDTVVCFEVSNAAEMLENGHVWFVMYETSILFSAASMARLFRECGFQVLDVRPSLGVSMLEIEARPSSAPTAHAAEGAEHIERIAEHVERFGELYSARVREWSERFELYCSRGRRVVLWCAGMRAISLMAGVPRASESVVAVVDVNPQRKGRYMPKTGKPVIAPEQVGEFKPDIVIAANPNYAEEIQTHLGTLGVSCDYEVLR